MVYFNGYCPESGLKGRQVRMRLNEDDFYESEETRLQIAIPFPGVEAVILLKRGSGKFRDTVSYADEVDCGECLEEQTLDDFPFSDAKLINDAEQLQRYIDRINLRHLRSKLEEMEHQDKPLKSVRHFDCKGNPYNCKVFLIGINPSLGLPFRKNFEDYWSNEAGFMYDNWFKEYEQEKKRVVGTRPRIKRLRDAFEEQGLNLLNCNVYPIASKRFKELKDKKAEPKVLKLLIDEIKPQIFILHGGIVKKKFEEIFGNGYSPDLPNWQVKEFSVNDEKKYVISVPHLYNMSNAENNKGQGVDVIAKLVLEALGK